MLRAFDILLRGLLDGDFAEDGRLVVRYLNPHVREEKRMTRAFLLGIIEQCTHEGCTDEETVHHHLSWCWIPRRLFKQWLIRRGLPSPPRFEPREPTQDERGESTPAYAQPSLLPSPEPNPERDNERALAAAIKKRLSAGEEPGVTVQWNQFCDAIRDAADGWADPKKTKLKRGYGDKTIKRIVAQVRMDKQDK
jgi:hypothetical protein